MTLIRKRRGETACLYMQITPQMSFCQCKGMAPKPANSESVADGKTHRLASFSRAKSA